MSNFEKPNLVEQSDRVTDDLSAPVLDNKIERMLSQVVVRESEKRESMAVQTGKAFERVIAPSAETSWSVKGYENLYLSLVGKNVPPEKRDFNLGREVVFDWAKKYIDFRDFVESNHSTPDLSDSEKRKMWANKNTRSQMILAWTTANQPAGWEPYNPPPVELSDNRGAVVGVSTVAKDLRAFVAKELEVLLRGLVYEDTKKPVFEPSKLGLFVGYGTPADTLAKADIFFLYEGVPLLIDTSLNQEKLNDTTFGITDGYGKYGLSLRDWDIRGLKGQELAEKRLKLSFELESHAKRIARTYARDIEKSMVG